MNIEKKFIEICQFIKKHETLIQTEVLELYPFTHLKNYELWIEDFQSLSDEKLIRLESLCDITHIKSDEYKIFLNQIKELLDIPFLKRKETQNIRIPKSLSRKLTLKKQHEILALAPIIENLSPKNLVDIGSGAGHLSSLLVHEQDVTSLCIDANEEYQKIGLKKLARENPKVLEKIKFKKLTIADAALKELKVNNSCLIGLHTCGDLSVCLVKNFHPPQFKSLVNLGCCYHKLTLDNLNLSIVAKKNGINLSYHALTMASKSYKKLDKKDFIFRERVKSYRYTIHLFMQEILKIEFKTLGNAKKEIYENSFINYVRTFLPEARNISDKVIEDFYMNKQQVISHIMYFGLIRSQMARVVELYIILDRALYLQENNKKVKVSEIFDKNISPRNYAIIATNN